MSKEKQAPLRNDIPPDLESLSRDFGKLLEGDAAFPDVELKCQDRTIPAHRAVLAARSEVFAAMFRNKMAESDTGVVDVADMDAQVLDLLLEYVYSGKIRALPDDLVSGLYAASDKYAVNALKKACSDRMTAGLTEDNCVSSLTLADAHSDAAFKEAVVSFICDHKEVLGSEVWSSLSEEHVKLANEVYHVIASKYPNPDDKCVQASTLDILPDLESLSHDFCKLLVNETFPDVQLRCGDRSIRAHRSILASRSDVFSAMFRNKMAESETGIVDVTDMDADVFDLLLKYVYSGKLSEYSDDTASSLYEAGDKYSIDALKNTCSDRIVGRLTEKNCLGFLTLADCHSDEGFKDKVVSFVAENLEALEKEAWSEFRKNRPLLALSVCERRLESTLSYDANTRKKFMH